MSITSSTQTPAGAPWTTPTLKSGHIGEHTSVTPVGVGVDFGIFS